jgi:DNA-binding XRE family transcriptional regulator
LTANRLRRERENRMLSKVELARKAGLATLTVSRIENGGKCRLETKGKILAALGLSVGEKEKVFPEK